LTRTEKRNLTLSAAQYIRLPIVGRDTDTTRQSYGVASFRLSLSGEKVTRRLDQ
jgi:hypothetical protein